MGVATLENSETVDPRVADLTQAADRLNQRILNEKDETVVAALRARLLEYAASIDLINKTGKETETILRMSPDRKAGRLSNISEALSRIEIRLKTEKDPSKISALNDRVEELEESVKRINAGLSERPVKGPVGAVVQA